MFRGFWGDSLTKPQFKMTSAEVVIICSDLFIPKRFTGHDSPLKGSRVHHPKKGTKNCQEHCFCSSILTNRHLKISSYQFSTLKSIQKLNGTEFQRTLPSVFCGKPVRSGTVLSWVRYLRDKIHQERTPFHPMSFTHLFNLPVAHVITPQKNSRGPL